MGTFMFDRLDSLLKSSGITRKALCQASGHADNYIRMFEKRNTEPPREFVNFCAEQLGTTSAYLYGESDTSEKEKAPGLAGLQIALCWSVSLFDHSSGPCGVMGFH